MHEKEENALENIIMFFNEENILNEELNKKHSLIITSSDLNNFIVDVCGILLFKKQNVSNTINTSNISFVYTETSEQNMINLALAVSQEKPILLEGEIGVGKTFLIQELANITCNTGNYINYFFLKFYFNKQKI